MFSWHSKSIRRLIAGALAFTLAWDSAAGAMPARELVLSKTSAAYSFFQTEAMSGRPYWWTGFAGHVPRSLRSVRLTAATLVAVSALALFPPSVHAQPQAPARQEQNAETLPTRGSTEWVAYWEAKIHKANPEEWPAIRMALGYDALDQIYIRADSSDVWTKIVKILATAPSGEERSAVEILFKHLPAVEGELQSAFTEALTQLHADAMPPINSPDSSLWMGYWTFRLHSADTPEKQSAIRRALGYGQLERALTKIGHSVWADVARILSNAPSGERVQAINLLLRNFPNASTYHALPQFQQALTQLKADKLVPITDPQSKEYDGYWQYRLAKDPTQWPVLKAALGDKAFEGLVFELDNRHPELLRQFVQILGTSRGSLRKTAMDILLKRFPRLLNHDAIPDILQALAQLEPRQNELNLQENSELRQGFWEFRLMQVGSSKPAQRALVEAMGISTLAEVLQMTDKPGAVEAAGDLSAFMTPKDRKTLIDVLLKRLSDDKVEVEAHESLIKLGFDEKAEIQKAARIVLSRGDPAVRLKAFQLLESLNAPYLKPLALHLLGDPDVSLRGEAIAQLKEIGDEADGPRVERLLNDPALNVARAALEALQKWNYPIKNGVRRAQAAALDLNDTANQAELKRLGALSEPALMRIVEADDYRATAAFKLLLQIFETHATPLSSALQEFLTKYMGPDRTEVYDLSRVPGNEAFRKQVFSQIVDTFSYSPDLLLDFAAHVEKVGNSQETAIILNSLLGQVTYHEGDPRKILDAIYKLDGNRISSYSLDRLIFAIESNPPTRDAVIDYLVQRGDKNTTDRIQETLQLEDHPTHGITLNMNAAEQRKVHAMALALYIRYGDEEQRKEFVDPLRKEAWIQRYTVAARGAEDGSFETLRLFREAQNYLTVSDRQRLWGDPWQPGLSGFLDRHSLFSWALHWIPLGALGIYFSLLAALTALDRRILKKPSLVRVGFKSFALIPGYKKLSGQWLWAVAMGGVVLSVIGEILLYGGPAYIPVFSAGVLAFAWIFWLLVDQLTSFVPTRILIYPFFFARALWHYYRHSPAVTPAHELVLQLENAAVRARVRDLMPTSNLRLRYPNPSAPALPPDLVDRLDPPAYETLWAKLETAFPDGGPDWNHLHPETQERLLKAVLNPSARPEFIYAAWYLSHWKVPQAIDPLLVAINSPLPQVSRAARRAMDHFELNEQQAIALRTFLITSDDLEDQALAYKWFRIYPDPEIISTHLEPLLFGLNDQAPEIFNTSVFQLISGYLANGIGIDEIRHTTQTIWGYAAKIGHLHETDPAFQEFLKQMMGIPYPNVDDIRNAGSSIELMRAIEAARPGILKAVGLDSWFETITAVTQPLSEPDRLLFESKLQPAVAEYMRGNLPVRTSRIAYRDLTELVAAGVHEELPECLTYLKDSAMTTAEATGLLTAFSSKDALMALLPFLGKKEQGFHGEIMTRIHGTNAWDALYSLMLTLARKHPLTVALPRISQMLNLLKAVEKSTPGALSRISWMQAPEVWSEERAQRFFSDIEAFDKTGLPVLTLAWLDWAQTHGQHSADIARARNMIQLFGLGDKELLEIKDRQTISALLMLASTLKADPIQGPKIVEWLTKANGIALLLKNNTPSRVSLLLHFFHAGILSSAASTDEALQLCAIKDPDNLRIGILRSLVDKKLLSPNDLVAAKTFLLTDFAWGSRTQEILKFLETKLASPFPGSPQFWNFTWLNEFIGKDPQNPTSACELLAELDIHGILGTNSEAAIDGFFRAIQKCNAPDTTYILLKELAADPDIFDIPFLTQLFEPSEFQGTPTATLTSGDLAERAIRGLHGLQLAGVLTRESMPRVKEFFRTTREGAAVRFKSTANMGRYVQQKEVSPAFMDLDFLKRTDSSVNTAFEATDYQNALTLLAVELGPSVSPVIVRDIATVIERSAQGGWSAKNLERLNSMLKLKQGAFSPLHIYAAFEKQTLQPWDFLPDVFRRTTFKNSGALNDFLSRISRAQLTDEKTLAALYAKFRCDLPSAASLDFDDFALALIHPDAPSEYRPLIHRFLQHNGWQERTALSKEEQDQIIALSVALHKKALRAYDPEKAAAISFRELVRFNVDFSRFYLQQSALGPEKTFETILELFIITAHNIYGRIIHDHASKEGFVQLLKNSFFDPAHGALFGQAELVSPGFVQNIEAGIRRLMDYADYHQAQAAETQIPIKRNIAAKIARALQVESPLLLKVDGENSLFVEEVLQEMADQPDTEAVFISMSPFTKRRELFGMYMPKKSLSETEVAALLESAGSDAVAAAVRAVQRLDAESAATHYSHWSEIPDLGQDSALQTAVAAYLKMGDDWREDMEWRDGLLVRIAREARSHPERKLLLVFENIEACPDSVRVQLNPVLWEKMVEVPDKGERLVLPANLHMIFTMHKDSQIKDDSFMNRPLVQTVDTLQQADKRGALSALHLPSNAIDYLLKLGAQIQDASWADPVSLSFMDILEIAKRIQGRAQDNEMLDDPALYAPEAFNYLYLRLTNKADRALLKNLCQTIFPGRINLSLQHPPMIELRGEELFFDGVGLKAAPDFLAYARQKTGAPVKLLLLEFYGFDLGDMEARVFSQLARALKYGNRAVQLEGPSGEGKTEIGRVFTRLIGFQLDEKTINHDTDLSEFRGQLRPTREGRYTLYEPPYLTRAAAPGHVFLENEINTNQDSGLYYWLFPELSGQREKHLPEFPEADDSLQKKMRIDQNNLWLFTVNPEAVSGSEAFGSSFAASREAVPARISAHMPRFHVAQDPEDLLHTIRSFFSKKGLDSASPFAQALYDTHLRIREARQKGVLRSPQTVSKRELLRVLDRFKSHLDEGLNAAEAFQLATEEIYLFLWNEVDDIQKARELLEKQWETIKPFGVGHPRPEPNAQNVLKEALHRRDPVLVFFNATEDIPTLTAEVQTENPGAQLHPIALGRFHGKRQLVAGLVPAKNKGLEMRLGLIPELIREARLAPGQDHVALLYNYTRLNPRVVPLLNEFWQTGTLEAVVHFITPELAAELKATLETRKDLWPALRADYGAHENLSENPSDWDHAQWLAFAQWFYSTAPKNLKAVAFGSAKEKLSLSEAEVNRFLPVNISQPLNTDWVKTYIEKATQTPTLKPFQQLIENLALEAFTGYEEQMKHMEYDHNRLGKLDFDAFLNELAAHDVLDEALIKKLAFYTLGIGLRDAFREKLSFQAGIPAEAAGRIHYEKRSDGIYLIVDGIASRTYFEELPATEFLPPIRTQVASMAAMLIAIRHGRPIATEGAPGGGKTTSFQELSRRLGLPFYKISMFEDIDLGEFLGRLSTKGRDYILTSQKDAQGRYVLDFLRAYSEGGILLLDEGAIGINGQEVIAYLTQLAQMDELDLGLFHPGMKGEILKRAGGPLAPKLPPFVLGIAQNPAGSTRAREPLTYRTDTETHKIWTDNRLSMDDALQLIDHYLETDRDQLTPDFKRQVAQVHLEMMARHPQKDELSPRQLIMVVRHLRAALRAGQGPLHDVERALFTGITVSYLSGLNPREFEDLWASGVASVLGASFGRFLAEWDQPLTVKRQNSIIQIDDVLLPASGSAGNVADKDVFIHEDLPSQNRAMREIAAKFSLNSHVALLEEDGADALDLVKKFANKTGYTLETLWSHPQMTRMHLLSAILPRFESDMDKYGIRREDMSQEFELSLGFLFRHLITEEQAANLDPAQQTQQILFFHLMDAIPERQRVLLNEILTTRRFSLPDATGRSQTYLLPDWVHIVVSCPEEHQFSSAFINRFDRPIRVRALTDEKDLAAVFQDRYSLVRNEEVAWIKAISEQVYQHDKLQAFGLRYGFSPMDALKLARIIHLEKQRDIEAGRFNPNPVYYFVKAIAILYRQALEEADREKFDAEIAVNLLATDVFHLGPLSHWKAASAYAQMLETIDHELATAEREPFLIRVRTSELIAGQSLTLPNGIQVQKTQEGFILRTPGNLYEFKTGDLSEWHRLSEGLQVKADNGELLLELSITRSIGGVEVPRDDFNKNLALPEEEVSTPEFIRQTPEIRRLFASLLRAWQPLEDRNGHSHLPRVALLNGETGPAKTTGIRNLARIWGVPLYILNAYADLKVADATMGLKVKQGQFEVNIKEFFARAGKINGRKIALPSKMTSSRNMLLIDEANASPELLYALLPFFRGEKRFTFEYAGEAYDIELEDEAMIVLTFNPVEKYGGRGAFAREIVAAGEKLWSPNPLKYDDERLVSILSEYHRRGITQAKRDLMGQVSVTPLISQEGHVEVMAKKILLKTIAHPLVWDVEQVLEGVIESVHPMDPARTAEKKPAAQKSVIEITYDLSQIKHEADTFTADQGHLYFAQAIIAGFVKAVANGDAESVTDVVLQAADRLDPQIRPALEQIINVYQGSEVLESELRGAFFGLRRLFIANRVALFQNLVIKAGHPYVLIFPVPLADQDLRLEKEDFEVLGLERYAAEDVRALFVKKDFPGKPKGEGGHFDGEFAFVFEETCKRFAIPGVPLEEFFRWTAWHEMAHMLDQIRWRREKTPIPKNVELFAMLFPAIFSSFAKEYLVQQLIPQLLSQHDPDDCYCQAIKGILNGYWIALEQVAPHDLITNAFEKDKIAHIETLLQAASSEQLRKLAVQMYQNPATYLSTAGPGKYRRSSGTSADGSNESLIPGTDGEVEIDFDDRVDDVEIKVDQESSSEKRLKRDTEKNGHGEPGKGKGTGGNNGKDQTPRDSVVGDLQRILSIAPNLVTRFLDIFAGTPKVSKEYSDEGDEIDLERRAAKDLEPFYRLHVVQGLAALSTGIFVDSSGSTYSKPDGSDKSLQDIFQEMARYYTSLFFYAAVRNRNVEFTLNAVGDRNHPLLEFKDSRIKNKVETALQGLATVNDGGGINTLAVIEGIRQKYQNHKSQPHKLEFVFTDGGETSGESFEELNRQLAELEKTLGVDIVFVGVNTPEVSKYHRYLVIDHVPTVNELILLIINLSLTKVKRGRLPEGNLESLVPIQRASVATVAPLSLTGEAPSWTMNRLVVAFMRGLHRLLDSITRHFRVGSRHISRSRRAA